jgi:hypothetical protein
MLLLRAKPDIRTTQRGSVPNPAAFNQPCVLGGTASASTPSLISRWDAFSDGLDALAAPQRRLPDRLAGRTSLSHFKLTERFSLQFRSEFFNILNHPN